LKITITGFTDSYGSPVYNRQLSEFRADMVKNYLIGQGVSASNIEAIGKGQQNPLGSNKTYEGRQLNRRVEIKVHYH
jgi:OOP family OmpA-OmpF porin